MTIQLVPFNEVTHYLHIEEEDEDYSRLTRRHILTQSHIGVERGWSAVHCGPDENGIDTERVLGVCGVRWADDGSLYGWVWISAELQKHPLLIQRYSKAIMQEICTHFGENVRITCTVDRTFRESHRWIKRLGFRAYGQFHFYDPEKEDQIFYEAYTNGS